MLLNQLSEAAKAYDNIYSEAVAYHELGYIAHEQRCFDAAEGWYKKSLDISLKLGNDLDAAGSYHQLGMISQERRDFDAAEDWYKKSLSLSQKMDNSIVVKAYHQLGMIAKERQDFDVAEDWYKKSLALKCTQEDEQGTALTYLILV